MTAPVTLLCTVRGCGQPLARQARRLTCPRGHSFDLARSGYCNLLQPQDRRSRHPGDSAAAAAARRRLMDAGQGDWLLPHLAALGQHLSVGAGAPVLDVGCGEGFYLGSLASRLGWEAHGLDLSVAALDLAARRWPQATWLAANADRFLPYASDSFQLAMCLTSRLNPAELRRVAGGGHLVVAVAGPDDLIELRQAVLGEGQRRDRLAVAAAALSPDFELAGTLSVRHTSRLGAASLHDLLAATYRAGRARERHRAASLESLDVTSSRNLAWFRPRPA